MRKQLKLIENKHELFTGIFERIGQKEDYGHIKKTVLLLNIVRCSTGGIITKHLWFNYNKGFQLIEDLKKGDILQFKARVKSYTKGYFGYRTDVYKPVETDYHLFYPTNIKRVFKANGREVWTG